MNVCLQAGPTKQNIPSTYIVHSAYRNNLHTCIACQQTRNNSKNVFAYSVVGIHVLAVRGVLDKTM